MKKNKYLICLLIILLSTTMATAQCQSEVCQNLYISLIQVPSGDQDMIDLRDALDLDIGATLNKLSDCAFVERSSIIDKLIEREKKEFSEATFKEIREYRDSFKRSVSWMLTGEIRKIDRFERLLDVRIIHVATRTARYRFTYRFRYDYDFDYDTFLRGFQITLLEETGQLLRISGYTNYEKVNPGHIRVTPGPWNDDVTFDQERSEFAFHMSRCDLERQKMRIDIRSASFAGHLDTVLNVSDQQVKEMDVGQIKLTTTKGLNFQILWPNGALKHDDFNVEDLTFRSPDQFLSKQSPLPYTKNEDGFTFMFPAGIPANAKANLTISSRNYGGYSSPLQLGIDQEPLITQPGQRRKFLLRKFIPGLHQFTMDKYIEGSAILLAQGVTARLHLFKIDRAREREFQASTTNSFVTRKNLLQAARKDRDWANFYLGTTIAVYLFNWYHAVFIAPYFPKKESKKYEITPTYEAGALGLNLSLKIATQ